MQAISEWNFWHSVRICLCVNLSMWLNSVSWQISKWEIPVSSGPRYSLGRTRNHENIEYMAEIPENKPIFCIERESTLPDICVDGHMWLLVLHTVSLLAPWTSLGPVLSLTTAETPALPQPWTARIGNIVNSGMPRVRNGVEPLFYMSY